MAKTMAQLEQEVEELKAVIQSLRAEATIPYDIRSAFTGVGSGLQISSKGQDTEDVAINEAGSANHIVMNDPDGFLETTVAGSIRYIPYFN